MNSTPNLANEFHPIPKPNKKVTMPHVVKKVGEKTNRWVDVREVLKERFYKAKITECEIKLKGCWKTNALGFAHLEKRRKLTADDLYTVVLACNPCHQQIEILSPEDMSKTLQQIIDNRKVKI